MEKPSRVLIAEDHTVLREGLRSILDQQSDLVVVGEAADGGEAVKRAAELKPDLVLLDLSMPRIDGLPALREIKRSNPLTKVVVLTVHKAHEFVHAAFQNGADGYVVKNSGAAEVLQAMRSVLSGNRYVCPTIASQVIEGYLSAPVESEGPTSSGDLSSRELEVLKLVGEGYRSREIANSLCISTRTVEKHRANLMRKLNVRNASELSVCARERGLVSQ